MGQRLAAANLQQQLALDAQQNVWISASAGSGKTDVLVRRMLALLLADEGLQPREIIALTYTRAGAREMAERLPAMLEKWCALEDAALVQVVRAALPTVLDDAALVARVRGLLVSVRVAPPLVATIHALAQNILARAPLEAGLLPGFELLDGGAGEALLREIQHRLLVQADGPLREVLALLLDELGEYGWRDLSNLLVREWWRLRELLAGRELAELLRALDTALGLRGDEGWALGAVRILDDEMAVLRRVAGEFSDHAAAAVLALRGRRQEVAWRQFLLTKDGTVRKNILKKDVVKVVGEEAVEVLGRAAQRVETQMRLRKVLRGRQLTEALLVWGMAVRGAYGAEKQRRGVVDYADLLDALETLLAKQGAAVAQLEQQYKHLLLDEGQDNSPQQGRIVAALCKLLLAGEVGREGARTVLAVGDVKQSIFRFQGAKPELFLALRDELQRWAGVNFRAVDMTHSFRSAHAILAAVDAVFAAPDVAALVQGEVREWPVHKAVWERAGRVEVWPLMVAPTSEKAAPWALAEERLAAQGESAAAGCFRQIGQWILAQQLVADEVMIVVRKNEMVALAAGVLRGMGIKVAAAVRDGAVEDVVAGVRWGFNPHDRVALVTVLKGFFGWDDGQILALAARAGDGAWHEAVGGEEAVWLAEIAALRFGPPLALVQRLVASVGEDLERFVPLLEWAEQAVDVRALVARLEREDVPVARGREGVRILTVHGAKGLQAKVVVVADTTGAASNLGRERVLWGDGLVLFKSGKEVSDLEDALISEEEARQLADSWRGLYVAMTRAADRLVICGWQPDRQAKECWYEWVLRAVEGWRLEGEVRVLEEAPEGDIYGS
ncbi:MAG: hypothetical protein EBQ80_00850 [Proteobacteria bacterium]|nr:hypothetical protein [Pseudomonadota bacterium]